MLKPLYPHNRKYIGAKTDLLPFIEEAIRMHAPAAKTALDPFAGTGVVAVHLARMGLAVTAADLLMHNALAARCFMGGRPGEIDWAQMAQRLTYLQGLEPVAGYATAVWGGTYFTPENAGRIDAIREAIAEWERRGEISPQELAVLLTSLVYAVDKVANTVGQYDAFLKHLGAEPYGADGRHRVDANVYRPLQLGLPQVVESVGCEALVADSLALVPGRPVDLLYLDPPYNSRQYIDNYHLLENLVRWEQPPVIGKTAKFERAALKSSFSSRRRAGTSLATLIRETRAGCILLSYNSEGIVPDELILGLLAERGRVTVYRRPYPIFGHGAGRSKRRPIEERLFVCDVESPPTIRPQ
ncbi:MAG TPA: DNA adenine methylase [Symbiobacteriaceae bacterium]|nr:DNA adenine methylase [Symbiobacteriaceae bacterium]